VIWTRQDLEAIAQQHRRRILISIYTFALLAIAMATVVSWR